MLFSFSSQCFFRSTVGVLAGMAMVIGQYTNRFEFFVIGHLFAGVVLAFKV